MAKFLDDTGLTHFWEKIKANFFRYNRDPEQALDMDDIRTPGVYTGDFVTSSCPYKMSDSTEKYHLIVTEYSDSTVENMVSQIAIYKLQGVSLIYHRHSYLHIQEESREFAWGNWHRILTQQDLDDLAGDDIPYIYGSTPTIKDKIEEVEDSIKTYSAGTGLALDDTTFYLPIPRVAESCNTLPDRATIRFREYAAGANYNLPTNAWYHILEIRSVDTNYGTQLALGMTADAAYYRKYSGSAWGSWHSLVNTNTTYSAGTGISLSGTIFSNSGVRSATINGNHLRVNTNGTNADLTIPYATNANKATYAALTNAGSTSGTTAKNFSIPAAATEIIVTGQFSSKILSASIPRAILTTSNKEVWLTGGRGASGGSGYDGALRCLCNLKVSSTSMSAATTLTLQGVTANDQNTDRTSAVTWHVFYR